MFQVNANEEKKNDSGEKERVDKDNISYAYVRNQFNTHPVQNVR